MLSFFKDFILLTIFQVGLSIASTNTTSDSFLNVNRKGDMGFDYYVPTIPNDIGTEDTTVLESILFDTPLKQLNHTGVQDTSNDIVRRCKHYKNGEEIDSKKMADVWQAVYYQLPDTIECFKILIRSITNEEKKAYAKKYETIADSVDWTNCDFEIKGALEELTGRSHFLVGGKDNKGVMDNYISLKESDNASLPMFPNDANATYTMHKEAADQWKVVKDLLLMRDCDEGFVIVFSRVPRWPSRDDIWEALRSFGEDTMNGKFVCEKLHKHEMSNL